jgi:hypothetical protein
MPHTAVRSLGEARNRLSKKALPSSGRASKLGAGAGRAEGGRAEGDTSQLPTNQTQVQSYSDSVARCPRVSESTIRVCWELRRAPFGVLQSANGVFLWLHANGRCTLSLARLLDGAELVDSWFVLAS